MHSAGLELTKLTYTRLEDNLIRHRGGRSPTIYNHASKEGYVLLLRILLELGDLDAFIPALSYKSICFV